MASFSKPSVCAITALDLDHTSLLGNTIEQIAWQKAGIFKPGVPAYSSTQVSPALRVLRERADELGADLAILPQAPVNSQMEQLASQLFGPGVSANVPLALNVAKTWLRLNGVMNCSWPGRYHVVNKYPITYFLDGAMTPKSMELCASWFKKKSDSSVTRSGNICRVLIFNCTMDRKPSQLLPYLVSCGFDIAVFSPNCINSQIDPSNDQANMNVSYEEREARSEEQCNAWLKCMDKLAFAQEQEASVVVQQQSGTSILAYSGQKEPLREQHVIKTDSVTGALDCVRHLLHCDHAVDHSQQPSEIHVLVTGSLHLVGAVLSRIAPDEVC